MKIIQVKITVPEEKTIAEPDYHFCYQCKHFVRHYIHGYSGRSFTPLEWGHCCRPKEKYSRSKQRKATDCACLWFEEKEDTR